ncbi:P-loop containing nucleoside triphosphate hydrolase protein [Raphanus sativus]|nr:P-loop containing nucleoside triphosphate hydrolase protein [Raphanus sativus]
MLMIVSVVACGLLANPQHALYRRRLIFEPARNVLLVVSSSPSPTVSFPSTTSDIWIQLQATLICVGRTLFQVRELNYGVDVGVGTPGRIVDLMKRGALNLSKVQFVVLDEADQMLQVGFV